MANPNQPPPAPILVASDLATALPMPCLWKGWSRYGAAYHWYQFGNDSGSGISAFEIYGNADGQRLVKCATKSRHDVLAAVSFYMNNRCTDAGLW